MDVAVSLEVLQKKAAEDIQLRKRLWDTRKSQNPLSDFCRICREQGEELYEMDLLQAGEELYAAMKRSTNGGGENSPVLKGKMICMSCFCPAAKVRARQKRYSEME